MKRIALLGMPNCGKSTLFNRLLGRKRALVDPTPGVTRDRIEGEARIGDQRWAVYSLHVPGSNNYNKSKHKALADEVLAHEPLEHVLVTGDFNVATQSPILKSLQESAGLANAITDRSIDHILYKSPGSLRVAQAGLDNGPAVHTRTGLLSDHPYAWAALAL